MTDAYTAGLVDGEGTVTLTRKYGRSPYRIPTVSITSTSRELLDFLIEEYGGLICNISKSKQHHKRCWIWAVRCDRALEMLDRILPYMKERDKIARAQFLLEHYKSVTPRNGKYTEEQRTAKLNFEIDFFRQ